MSDEPRDGQPDGTADPTGDAPDPLSSRGTPDSSPGTPSFQGDAPADDTPRVGAPAADPPVEDSRTDGSRTDVSAPWERPRRWERSSLDADRVDALLARLGNPDGDRGDAGAPTDQPDTRRNRRRNNDGDTVSASSLIAALGESDGETPPGPDAAIPAISARPGDGDAAGGEGDAHAGEVQDGEVAPGNDGPAALETSDEAIPRKPESSDEAFPAAVDKAPVDGAPGGTPTAAPRSGSPEPDPGPDESGPADEPMATDEPTAAVDHHGDPHTGPLPRASDNAADLAEASSIRAALDRRAGVGTPTAAATTSVAAPATKKPAGRQKAAGPAAAATAASATGTTLVHGAGPRRHRGWLYAGRTIAGLVAFCTLLGVGVEWKITDRAETVIENNAVTAALNTTDPSISTARTTAVVRTNSRGVTTTMAAPPKTVYQPENILLLGSDTRAGANEAIGGADGEDTSSQSDTLMVAHISGDREHVTVLSIPRDTMVPAPTNCHSWDAKTNTYAKELYQVDPGQMFHITNTYAVGGPQCIVSAVQGLTGLGITRLIGIDFKGFQAMVGALGGVTVNICKPIRDTVLGNVAPTAGVQVVQGQQALDLVRARHVIGDTESDLARIRRQQVVLSAILRQVTQAGTLLNPGKLDGFLQAFSKNTFTQNVKLEDLVRLAGSLGSLDPAHVTFYTMPTVPRDDGALDVDKAKAAPVFDDLVNDLPLPGEVPATTRPTPSTTVPTTASNSLKLTVAPSKVALALYNLSGRDDVVTMAQQELNAAGFAIDDDQLFPASRTQAATVVQYAPANRAAALTVAAAVPGSTLLVTPGLGTTIRLQLGSSFAGVVKTVAVGQQAPASLSTAISTGPSAPPSTTSAAASTALSSVNAAAGTCA